jgi:hypothetical protein
MQTKVETESPDVVASAFALLAEHVPDLNSLPQLEHAMETLEQEKCTFDAQVGLVFGCYHELRHSSVVFISSPP